MEILFALAVVVVGVVVWVKMSEAQKEKEQKEAVERALQEKRDGWINAYAHTFGNGSTNQNVVRAEVLTHALVELTDIMPNVHPNIMEAFGRVISQTHIDLKYDDIPAKIPDDYTTYWHKVTHSWNRYVRAVALSLKDQLSYYPTYIQNENPWLTVTQTVTVDMNTFLPPLFDPIADLTTQRYVLNGYSPPRRYEGYGKKINAQQPWSYLEKIDCDIPIDNEFRFQHTWIVAPPGTGKSNFLMALIEKDILSVIQQKASVIVMESNRDLIKHFERSRLFRNHTDKLVIIDVEDVENPIALNLFDMGKSEGLSPRDQEALYNSTVSMLDYVFRALLGAELTSRQSTLFNFTIALCLKIPHANLDTLIEIMHPKGSHTYRKYIEQLEADAQSFFSLKFDSREFEQTKAQVVDRLFAIKRVRTLARMFSATETKLNLYDLLQEGKCILINTSKALLSEEGTEIFSRFMLALILLAAERRAFIQQKERKPTYVFIDEAQDVIRRDDKLPVILDQARKFKVGITLAHQRLDQMTPPVLNALYSSTAIKFAAHLSDANASALARNMGCSPDFFSTLPPHTFAAYVRGVTSHAATFKPRHVVAKDQLSDREHGEIVAEMRRRYSTKQPEPPKFIDPTIVTREEP